MSFSMDGMWAIMKLIYCFVLNIQKQIIESLIYEGVMTFFLNTLKVILKVNVSQQKIRIKKFHSQFLRENPFVDPEPRKKFHVTMSRGN